MQQFKWVLLLSAGVFWILLMPVAFVTFYSVVELQSAARAASDKDPRLAMLHTLSLAQKLDIQNWNGQPKLHGEIREKRNVWLMSRSNVRYAAIDILTSRGVKQASATCTAPQETITKCVTHSDGSACLADWMIVQKCYDNALQLDGITAKEKDSLRGLMQNARQEGFEYNRLVARWTEVNDLGQSSLLPVAEALRQPWTKQLLQFVFALPQGAVVACFTSLMAVLGAGVASLIKLQRSRRGARTDAIKSFLVAPLIGGLTGFMVYFVVSAGTAIFVQPSPSDAAQPAANLSAPALASLGVLAGLAAEQAISWLQQKASAFFGHADPAETRPGRNREQQTADAQA